MATQASVFLDSLPEVGLFEILRRLPGSKARSVSACLSKRWLILLSHIRKSEILHPSNGEEGLVASTITAHLERSLEGTEATDVSLAAVSIGTSSRGGLKKLEIRNSQVSDIGLKSIACGSPFLKVISLQDVPSISDEGLQEIAKECRLLEELDLIECPSLTNRGLMAIVESSPNLASLAIESCQSIGDQNFQAICLHCPKLKSISIIDCPLIRDQGVADLVFSTHLVLTELQLQGQSIGNATFDMVRHLKELVSLTVSSCNCLTDEALGAIGQGCCRLKKVHLRNCSISDDGIRNFVEVSVYLKSLKLEKCDKITLLGVFGVHESKLRSLALVKCKGVKDLGLETSSFVPSQSLRVLSIRKCSGFGNSSLDMVRKLCPNLHSIDLSGLCKITDSGLLPLVKSYKDGLKDVKLRGCIKLTDEAVSGLVSLHGETLELLNLKGCVEVTDASLVEIAGHCIKLRIFDVSGCSITDYGISVLSSEVSFDLEILFISGCSGVTNESLPSIIKLGKRLIALIIENCTSVSKSTVERLKESLKYCSIYT